MEYERNGVRFFRCKICTSWWRVSSLSVRTGLGQFDVGLVADACQELGFVGGGEVAEALDMFLLALGAPATEPSVEDGHHTDPGEA